MKIGVISDTHIVTDNRFRKVTTRIVYKTRTDLDLLREIVEPRFKGVDRIIHAGDLVSEAVMDFLEELAPLDVVRGNMDNGEMMRRLPQKKVLDIEGRRVGIIHGWGAPRGIIERIRGEFEKVDAVVFGHTHNPVEETRDGVYFFNPGSPTDNRFAPYNSLGILNIDAGGIKSEIIRL